MKFDHLKLSTARGALMLTAAISAFAMVGRAEACTVNGAPSGSASNATVDCSVDTTNSGPFPGEGYGTTNDNNNTYNVQQGVTLTGNFDGLVTGTGATINNSGSIVGLGNAGILGSSVTIFNSNLISGGANGIFGDIVDLTNSGMIEATDNLAFTHAILANTLTLNNKSGGVIQVVADNSTAITAQNLNVTANAGLIQATGVNSVGIFAPTATVNNLSGGEILALGAGGIAIQGDTVTVGNAGTIAADGIAISANALATIANSGVIQATANNGVAILATQTATVNNLSGGEILALGAGGFAIQGDTVTVGNAGTIAADGVAIAATTLATVANSGVIQATANNGVAISATQTATVNNLSGGEILAPGAGGFAIQGDTVTVGNAGTIAADGVAIAATTLATVANSHEIASSNSFAIAASTVVVSSNTGTISGGVGGILASTADVNNAGLITGQNVGITVDQGVNVTNTHTGTISGKIAIQAFGGNGVGSTITNSGAIISTDGAGGTAIKLSAAADTLTLLSGSHIVGVVDMGGGADIVNAVVNAPSSKVSSMTSVELPTFVNFNGKVNTTFGGGFNGPAVLSGLQLATLDPTALAQADRSLMDFTGGASSLVQGRLNGVSPTSNASMTAMSYAPENGNAGPFAKAPAANAAWLNPAPIAVWSSGFGSQRTQDATRETLRATSTTWGGAIGIDRKVRPDWLVGAFIGGGQGGLSVDLGSQKVDTDYVFGGAYSRFEWAEHFLDFTLQGGSAQNKSDRLVLNNLAAGGIERARASYHGWYVSPEVAYGFHGNIGNGYVLTPTARVRYVAGMFDGFAETGSAQGLRIGSRTLQNFEERGELEVSRLTNFGGDHALKTSLHGGVIARQRAGDATINAVLIEQNLAFTTPGKGSSVGWVAGAAFDYHVSRNVAVFGAVEGMAMSDQSRTVSAKGGIRAAF
jgi:hypothetical protein